MAAAAAAAASPSVELALIDDPSFSSSSAIAAAGVFFKFLGWTLLYLATAAVVLGAILAAYVWVSRELARRRRRREEAAERRLRLQLQRQMMTATVRHAPFRRLRAAGVVRNPCVVCRTEFEDGEVCSVLPACVHVFHTACLARWLRYHTTCPVCDATVDAQLGEQLLNDV